MFSSRGDNYTAFLHASTGDLIQQYDDFGYYPEITPDNPIRLRFTATSSRSSSQLIPDSIDYKIGDTALSFNTSGVCTTSGAASYFKKSGLDLLIIGNIADYLNKTSSVITAIAKKNDETLFASCPVSISYYVGGQSRKVSIAPGDNKNFTLSSQTDSVILKAGVLSDAGWEYNDPDFTYVWEIADANEVTGWRQLSSGTGNAGTITVPASEVDTYANVRVSVYSNGPLGPGLQSQTNTSILIGSDAVGILDASDPLDIILSVKINKTGTGSEVDAESLELEDTMPDAAYLLFTPTLVQRGTTTSVGTTTWLNGILCNPAGMQTRNIIPVSGKYKVTVADLKSSLGEHTLVMTGKLA